jgi:hypothetical protein
MTGLDVLMAVVGSIVTVLVIVGMVLLTPRENVDLRDPGTDRQGDNLSSAEMRERPAARPGSSPA